MSREILGGIGDEAAVDLAGQIAAVRDLGWGQLELRCVDGIPVGDLPGHRVAEVAAAVRAAGLTVPCVDSRIGNWARPITGSFADELAELDAVSMVAHEVGARHVRVMSYPNDGLSQQAWEAETIRRFRLLVERAADRDVVLVHENCSGWAGRSAARACRLLELVDSPHLRLLFDVGNPVAHDYDGLAYLADVLPWVVHVHLKDALPAGPDRPEVEFVGPGRGDAHFTTCLDMLRAAGYQGALSAEPHIAVVPHTGKSLAPDVVRAQFLEYGRAMTELCVERGLA